MSDLPLSKT